MLTYSLMTGQERKGWVDGLAVRTGFYRCTRTRRFSFSFRSVQDVGKGFIVLLLPRRVWMGSHGME